MSKNYVTGMLMLGNQEYNDLMNRPFKDAQDTVHRIINNWNEVVEPDDTVYILGGIGKLEYLQQLKGNLKVVLNMHDLKNVHFESAREKLIKNLKDANVEVIDIKDINFGDDFNVCSSFTDMVIPNGIINLIATGGLVKFGKGFIDVSIDTNYLRPYCFEDDIVRIANYILKDRYREIYISRVTYDSISLLEDDIQNTNNTQNWGEW